MSPKLYIRDTDIPVTEILDLISRGFTYEQILLKFKGLTYKDIFLAAELAKTFI
jgi:uncharacterized protein (DUF433 family)